MKAIVIVIRGRDSVKVSEYDSIGKAAELNKLSNATYEKDVEGLSYFEYVNEDGDLCSVDINSDNDSRARVFVFDPEYIIDL